jgi:hypothetical protein
MTMVEAEPNPEGAAVPESPPPETGKFGRGFWKWVFKVAVIFLGGYITTWLVSERLPHFLSLINNLNPLALFGSYLDHFLKHIAFSETYSAAAMKAHGIPAFLSSTAAKIVSAYSLLVTPFTALYSTLVDFFREFPHNPFNAVYAALELLIGALISLSVLPRGKSRGLPAFVVRVFVTVLAGTLLGCLFYGIIWLFGKVVGFLITISMAITYVEELLKAMVEERVHWLQGAIASCLHRKPTGN